MTQISQVPHQSVGRFLRACQCQFVEEGEMVIELLGNREATIGRGPDEVLA